MPEEQGNEVPQRIYWDSCIFIDCIQKSPAEWKYLAPVLDLASKGRIIIVTSMVTLVEVHKEHAADGSILPYEVDQFLQQSFIERVVVDQTIAYYARDIARNTGFANFDAVQIATAVSAEAPHIITRDGQSKTNTKRTAMLKQASKFPQIEFWTPEQFYNQHVPTEWKQQEFDAEE